jgi:hypothetical protein
MQFKIVRNIRADQVARHVPPMLKAYIPPLDDSVYTLLLFRFQRDEKSDGVVVSSTARRALSRLGEERLGRGLAFGGEFTLEARDLLREHGFRLVAAGDFGWTDERIKAVRER